MAILTQDIVNGLDIPRKLEWHVYKATTDLTSAIERQLQHPRSPRCLIGISVLLSSDAELEAIGFSIADRVFVYYPRVAGLAARKGSSSGVDAFASLLNSQNGCLVGFGMTRTAMHIRHAVNTHVRGMDLLSVLTGKKNMSPGELVRDTIDPSLDPFVVNTLWDAFPAELENDPRRLEFLCMRAWLAARSLKSIYLKALSNDAIQSWHESEHATSSANMRSS